MLEAKNKIKNLLAGCDPLSNGTINEAANASSRIKAMALLEKNSDVLKYVFDGLKGIITGQLIVSFNT